MNVTHPAPTTPGPFAGPELERARRPLTALARSLGNDPERAEELAQATLATAIERRDSFDASRALQPWLCGILVRLHARARRRRAHLGVDSLEGHEPPARAGSDPVHAAEHAELEAALAVAIGSCSVTDRAVLEPWLAGEGRGAALPATPSLAPGPISGAARVRLHRARQRLRRRLPRGLATLAALVGLGGRRARAEPAVGAPLVVGGLVGALVLVAWPVARGRGAKPPGTDPAAALAAGWSPAQQAAMPPIPQPEASLDDGSEPSTARAAPPTVLRFPARPALRRVPPGTVHLAGGETIIGTTPEAIQALIEEMPGAARSVRALDAETPRHTRSLAPFHLGATEVTNEQYEVFVRATGHRPPQHWGSAAVEAARIEFLIERGEANLALARAGRPTLDTLFDPERWWDENWNDSDWAVPDGEALHPVVYVDHADVRAYCRWAGVRPMTEFEFQHAARGATDRPYPWGTEWEDGVFCASNEDREHTSTRSAGTFPRGRSPEGVWDLSGNVWEWTSSPYVAYPRFRKNTYLIEGVGERMREPYWDGSMLVVVGGYYQSSRLVVRCTVRRPAGRDERTSALGFRIAASTTPARDLAVAANEEWAALDLALDGVVGVDCWTARPRRSGEPEGYAVITSYRVLALVPAGSADGEALLLTSEPLAEPLLEPGEYAVSRDDGELVLRDREGLERARIPASTPRPGAPGVEFWTEVAADGAEHDGLSLTAGGLRLDLLPRTPLHGWRR